MFLWKTMRFWKPLKTKIEVCDRNSPKEEKDSVEGGSELLDEDYETELEMLKSTRDNFLTWKDHDY